jgi:hypothetical protein
MTISKMKKHKKIIGLFLLFTLLAVAQLQTAGNKPVYAACPPSTTVQQNCIVTQYIRPGIQFLSAGVGVIIITMIIIGAIQYSTSGGNPQGEADARKKIMNALLAFVTFLFIFTFLNFLIPGGVIPI